MRTRRVLVTSALAAVFAVAPLGPATAEPFPDIIPIPTGSLPEGIATGTGTSIYAGSRADGSVWLGDLRTGEGDTLVEGTEGRMAVGMKVQNGLLFVSGGTFGDAYVYDATTGAEVAVLDLTDGPAFINDVTVTRDAAYFTNSSAAELYAVELFAGVPTGNVRDHPAHGGVAAGGGLQRQRDRRNAQRLDAARHQQHDRDPLQRRTRRRASAVAVDTGGADLTQGDGILLRGQDALCRAQPVQRRRRAARCRPTTCRPPSSTTSTDPDFDVPTTIAAQGSRLYVVNARFTAPPGPTTEHDIVKIDGE